MNIDNLESDGKSIGKQWENDKTWSILDWFVGDFYFSTIRLINGLNPENWMTKKSEKQ